MFGRYRTVAFDGCRSIKVPDTAGNRGWLGKLNAALGQTGYPVIQLMTLCETGTRALLGASFGTPGEGELAWARQLLHHLDQTMLVLGRWRACPARSRPGSGLRMASSAGKHDECGADVSEPVWVLPSLGPEQFGAGGFVGRDQLVGAGCGSEHSVQRGNDDDAVHVAQAGGDVHDALCGGGDLQQSACAELSQEQPVRAGVDIREVEST